mgnify:CR=1 FL=1|jgi:hypothetical protein
MAKEEKDLAILSENEVVELFVYFLTTARVQIDDPNHYGPMRLLFAAEKLRDFVAGRISPSLQKLFEDTEPVINRAHIVVNDTEKFTAELDHLSTVVAEYLVEVSGLSATNHEQ